MAIMPSYRLRTPPGAPYMQTITGLSYYGGNMAESISGVYQIENITNGDKYIGSSKSILRRWGCYRWLLRNGKCDNPHLQRAWDLYGSSSFVFSILECGLEQNELIVREQYHIDGLCPSYNIRIIADRNSGVKFSEESRLRMSQTRKGIKYTEERKLRVKGSHIGIKNSESTRAKLRGRHHTDEAKRKISLAVSGEKRKTSKLTENGIRDIRFRYAAGGITQRELGLEFGVNPSVISRVTHGKAWKCVTVEGK